MIPLKDLSLQAKRIIFKGLKEKYVFKKQQLNEPLLF